MGFSIPIFVCHSQVLVTHIPFPQPDNNRQIPVPILILTDTLHIGHVFL